MSIVTSSTDTHLTSRQWLETSTVTEPGHKSFLKYLLVSNRAKRKDCRKSGGWEFFS